jgi:hypothetical protein
MNQPSWTAAAIASTASTTSSLCRCLTSGRDHLSRWHLDKLLLLVLVLLLLMVMAMVVMARCGLLQVATETFNHEGAAYLVPLVDMTNHTAGCRHFTCEQYRVPPEALTCSVDIITRHADLSHTHHQTR